MKRGLFSLSSFLLFPEWNKTESSLVWWNFMFMNIQHLRVRVFNMPCALTLSISLCICKWGQSSSKAMGGLHTLRGTEQDTHGRCRCVLVYRRKGKILAERKSEKWVHSQRGCCSPASTSEQLPWEGIFASCARAARFHLPPSGLCTELKPYPGLCWDLNWSRRSIAAFY